MGRNKQRFIFTRQLVKKKLKQEPVAAIPKPEKHLPGPVRVLRGLSAVSIISGGAGLVGLFFWPAVIAVYFGFAVALLDVWLEEWSIPEKSVSFLIVLAVGTAFTVELVIHPNPIVFGTFVVASEQKEVQIRNDSEDDYSNFDVLITPNDGPNTFITGTFVVDNYPNCAVMDEPSVVRPGEDKLLMAEPNAWVSLSQTMRIRCQTLVRQSTLRIRFSLCEGVNGKLGLQPAAPTPSKAKVTGSFVSRYRTIKVDSSRGERQR